MQKIEILTRDWQEKGIITPEQRALILAHEGSRAQRSWVAMGIAGVGVFALALGFISLIASNWEAISDSTKLLSFFAIQGILATAIWRERASLSISREVLLTLFALLFLGGIGLVGQIYHLESDGWSGLAFWCAITFPILLFAKSSLINYLWFFAFEAALLIRLFNNPPMGIGAGERELIFFSRMFTAFGIAYLILAIGLVRKLPIVPYFCLAARRWGWFIVLVVGTVASNISFSTGTYYPFVAPMLGTSLWMCSALAIVSLFAFGERDDKLAWKYATAATIASSALAITIPVALNREGGGHQLLGIFWFMVPWVCAAAACALHSHQRLFNLCTLVIALRLVVAYFEVFGSLAATGVGLIVSGLVILGLLKAWFVVRARLAYLFKEPV